MKRKKVILIAVLCVVLTGLIGCKNSTQPETSPSPTTPYNLLDTMNTAANTSTLKISGEKNEYSITLDANETKDIVGMFQGYLLATGLASNLLKLQLIDITDEKNQRVLRTSTFYPGTSFVLRQYFSGTKTIDIRVTNTSDTENTIQIKFQ